MKIPGTRAIAFIGAWVMIGCAPLGLFAEETVGEKFRNVLADIDTWCRQEKIGPYLDPNDPEYKSKRRGTDCNILKLEPRDWRTEKMVRTEGQLYPIPERWLATPEGRFAHSIKLPAPHDKPTNPYRKGMDGEEYLDALCRVEAGEFAFRTITGVQAVRQDRPWIPSPGSYRDLVFWTREKGGGPLGAKPQDSLVQPPMGHYGSLEVRLSEADARSHRASFHVFFRDEGRTPKRDFSATTADGRMVTVPYVVSDSFAIESSARFAYTWRGIWPEHGLEHGIEGFDLIVYQIRPFEVLGLQRMYWRHLPYEGQTDRRLTRTTACLQYKGMKPPHQFVQSVLVPNTRP